MPSRQTRLTIRALWRALNPLARDALRSATLVIAQNEETRRWVPSRYRDKTVVFQNAVMEGVPPAPSPRTEGPPTALFAGRLNTWKGSALAVRAIARTTDWRLIVLGEGPERGRLEALSETLGVAGRIEFRGRVPHEELFRVMVDEADVFLFPSLHDDSALVVAEAVACGLPVVCLDIGGTPVIAGDRGIAVDPKRHPNEILDSLAEGLDAARKLGHGEEVRESVSLAGRASVLRSLVSERLGIEDQAMPHPSKPSSM